MLCPTRELAIQVSGTAQIEPTNFKRDFSNIDFFERSKTNWQSSNITLTSSNLSLSMVVLVWKTRLGRSAMA